MIKILYYTSKTTLYYILQKYHIIPPKPHSSLSSLPKLSWASSSPARLLWMEPWNLDKCMNSDWDKICQKKIYFLSLAWLLFRCNDKRKK